MEAIFDVLLLVGPILALAVVLRKILDFSYPRTFKWLLVGSLLWGSILGGFQIISNRESLLATPLPSEPARGNEPAESSEKPGDGVPSTPSDRKSDKPEAVFPRFEWPPPDASGRHSIPLTIVMAYWDEILEQYHEKTDAIGRGDREDLIKAYNQFRDGDITAKIFRSIILTRDFQNTSTGSQIWFGPNDYRAWLLASHRPQLGHVAESLAGALEKVGYSERSYFSVPGGFALATKLEQIYPDGRPM